MTEEPGEKIGSTDPTVQQITRAVCVMIIAVLLGALIADSVRRGHMPKGMLLATAAVWLAAGIASHSLAFWFGYAQREDELRHVAERIRALGGKE